MMLIRLRLKSGRKYFMVMYHGHVVEIAQSEQC